MSTTTINITVSQLPADSVTSANPLLLRVRSSTGFGAQSQYSGTHQPTISYLVPHDPTILSVVHNTTSGQIIVENKRPSKGPETGYHNETNVSFTAEIRPTGSTGSWQQGQSVSVSNATSVVTSVNGATGSSYEVRSIAQNPVGSSGATNYVGN